MRKLLCVALCVAMVLLLFGCGKNKEVINVEKAIEDLGNITIESENKIKDARTLYDSLDEELKKDVKNYAVLEDAEVSLVKQKIDNLGNVSKDDAEKITDLVALYDGLSDSQKEKIDNYGILEDAVEIVNSSWMKKYYVDEFGDYTENPYVSGVFIGTFSNTATKNSDLLVGASYSDSGMFMFDLLEYGNMPAYFYNKDLANLSFKIEGDATVYKIQCFISQNYICLSKSYSFEDSFIKKENETPRQTVYDIFVEALRNGKKISCSIYVSKDAYKVAYGMDCTQYVFVVDGWDFRRIEKDAYGAEIIAK